MPRGKELSPQMRSRICELHSIGYGYKRIQKIHPEISRSAIIKTCRLEASRINNQSKLRSGAPRKVSEEQRDHLYDIVTHQNPHITVVDLLIEVDHAVKHRAMQMLLREMMKRKWLQRKRVLLNEQRAAARLAWAKRYEEIDWRRVKWSDECMVERGKGSRPIYTFTRPRDQLDDHDVQEQQMKGVKQMFWAAFGHEYRTGLISLEGSVTGQGIVDLYGSYLPDFLEEGDIFMQDNAPVHTARIVQRLLAELRIEVMIWPPWSPDLNPIENLWALMKAEIHSLSLKTR